METNTSGSKKAKNGKKGASEPPAVPTPRSFASALTLDMLTRMDGDELDEVYRKGLVPTSLAALDGSPPGRMLALIGKAGRGVVGDGVRRLAAASFFPWAGKSFQSTSATAGTGLNRVKGLGERYPFDTRIEASAVDGAPCILLDYDKPENPFFIRAIRDELREVSAGLFLGPAMLKRKAGAMTVLWFAIDHTRG